MAKRKMMKMHGKGLKTGGAKDGARSSAKKQASALIPQNKMDGQRKRRMAKMEKADYAV